tara:strand:- start:172 stop:1605 length:1434 start_codon:yes stop_codon:yes gene_type:complete
MAETLDVSQYQERLDYLVPADYNFPRDDSGKRAGSHIAPFFFDGNPDAVLRYVLDENGLNDLEGFTPSYKALQKGVRRAITELQHQHQQRMDFEPDIQIQDDWFNDNQSVKMVQGVAISQHTISECFKQFMREEHANSPSKTNGKRQNSYDLWLERFGDGSISTITRDNVRVYRETLKRYPKNRKQRYDGLTLDDIAALNLTSDQYIAIPTVNGYLDMMRGFVSWLIEWKEFGDINPFDGVNLKDTRPEDSKRDPFSDAQLVAMFSSPVYQGCKSHTARGQHTKGSKIIRNAKFWLPLLALYSGARLGELCQLYVADVQKENEIWYMDINKNEDDKSVKANSFRTIPIHPKLINLGFLVTVELAKKKGQIRIFADVQIAADGKYSTIFSKRFTTFLEAFGIKTPKTCFHSTRHNFIDRMRNHTNVPEPLWESITGHRDGKASRGYGKSFSLEKRYEAIKQVRYPFLDDLLEHLAVTP